MHSRHANERAVIREALADSDDPILMRRTKRLEACCCAPIYAWRGNGTIGIAPGFCRDRACPTCQEHRGRETQARVRQIIMSMDAVRFLTLTLKHEDRPLRETLDRLYDAFRRLRQRPEWKSHVRGGVAVCEVTLSRSDGAWHAHLHVLTCGTFWAQKAIAALWLDVTGDSTIVDIRAVHSRDAAAKYVAKYVSKPADVIGWPGASIREYALAMHGRRLMVAFGTMHGKGSDADDCETRPALVEPLCSVPALLRRRLAGCPYAEFADGLLARLGGLYARACGVHMRPDAQRAGALSADEHGLLRVALKRCAGDESAWLPLIEPGRRFAGRSNSGETRDAAQMRLWKPGHMGEA